MPTVATTAGTTAAIGADAPAFPRRDVHPPGQAPACPRRSLIGDLGPEARSRAGFTNVTDLTFGRDGSLYAVQIATNGLLQGPKGSLVKVSRTGGKPTVIVGNLPSPYSVAVQGKSAYVSTWSVCAGGGQVIRVQLS